MSESVYIILIWANVLLAPPVAIVLSILIRKHWPHFLRPVLIACIVGLIAVVACSAVKLSFTSLHANVICLVLCYVAYCLLAASCRLISHRIYRFLATILMAAPIALMYALATFSALGFMFIIGDIVRPPYQKQTMAPGLECRLTKWGTAVTDSGYEARLYRYLPTLPIFEREVARISVNETTPRGSRKDVTCDDVLTKYTGRSSPQTPQETGMKK